MSDPINAILSGDKWNSRTVYYTFGSLSGNVDDSEASYRLFSTAERAAMRLAMKKAEEVSNLKFVEVSGSSVADIVIRAADLTAQETLGYAYYPDNTYGTDIVIDSDHLQEETLQPGSYNFLTLTHELGHAIGLKHSFEEGQILPANQENVNSTVMSYSDSTSSSVGGKVATNFTPDAPEGYQIYDIAALQQLYGVNSSFNSGNTAYVLDGAGTSVSTLWDGGGTDTLSVKSGVNVAAKLDLREGVANVSRVGQDFRWLAVGARIENATGGGGNDSLSGNDLGNTLTGLAGKDTLTGYAGNDTLDGGTGADRLSGGTGNDLYFVENAQDVLTEASNAGTDFVRATFSYTLGANVENLTLTGTANVRGTGNSLANLLTGNSGANSLTGGAGADTLTGASGKDTLTGADIPQRGRKEIDVLTGGDSADLFVLGGATGIYYDDRSTATKGLSDYAIIADFAIGIDRLTLSGDASDYRLGSSGINVSGIGLFHEEGANDELVAILKSATSTTLTAANTLAKSLFV